MNKILKLSQWKKFILKFYNFLQIYDKDKYNMPIFNIGKDSFFNVNSAFTFLLISKDNTFDIKKRYSIWNNNEKNRKITGFKKSILISKDNDLPKFIENYEKDDLLKLSSRLKSKKLNLFFLTGTLDDDYETDISNIPIQKINEIISDIKSSNFDFFISSYNEGITSYLMKIWRETIIDIDKDKNRVWTNAFEQFKTPEKTSNFDNRYISKLNLNDSQKNALNKIINCQSYSYLQGPPGTGKTHIISELFWYNIQNNKTNFITSSTHEAINNVMERMSQKIINPNIIYFRKTSSTKHKERALKFSEEYLTYNFINQMDNFYFLNHQKHNSFHNKIKEWNSKLDSELIDRDLDLEIKNIMCANKLINVIGITTYARPTIRINEKNYDLKFNYQIDCTVIDEVSKAKIPEILSTMKISKKVLFSGDYHQLNPFFKINETVLNDFFKWLNKKDDEYIKEKNDLENLFGHSFFKEQIKYLKNNFNYDRNLFFLNIQYRFTKQINDLVNIGYDDTEKLTFAQGNNKIFRNIKISKDKDYDLSEVSTIIIDSTKTNDLFIDDLNEHYKNIKLNNDEDNSKQFLSAKKSIYTNINYDATINDYHAFIIINLLNKIMKNNIIDNKDIGIITMTNSQAKNIKQIMKFKNLNSNFNNIEIDTIDNFQGREKSIIIIDLVLDISLLQYKNFNALHYIDFNRLNVAISRAQDKLIIIGPFKNGLINLSVPTPSNNGIKNVFLFKKWWELVMKNHGIINSELWNMGEK